MIRVRLELYCGGDVEDMFTVGGVGKSGSSFTRAYLEYTAQVKQLDANICAYLKVCMYDFYDYQCIIYRLYL